MRRLASAIAALVVAGLLSAAPATGARAADHAKEHGWGRAQPSEEDLEHRPAPSPKTIEHHTKALEYVFEEHYDEAKQELDKLIFSRLNPVEKAIVLRDYAYIATGRGDHAEARRRLEAAIATGGLLPDDARDARFQIATLFMQDEDWKRAAETLEVWFKEEPKPNANSYYILALCYYQEQKYDEALTAARKSVDMTKEPKESWLRLLLGIYLTRKDYTSSLPVLEELLALYPNKSYLMSLSTVYGALGNYDEAAIPLQLAQEMGLIDSDEELRRLAQMLLYVNQPYDAASVLAKGLDGGVVDKDSDAYAMLANGWIAAREYDAAVKPLEEAARLAKDGGLYVRLAQVHVQRENWSAATDALKQALAKGLDKPGEANLLMGICLYSQNELQDARDWFAKASRFESSQKEAKAWLQHIDQELAAHGPTPPGPVSQGG